MDDNIFDAERARRLTILRQQQVPNVIRMNPDTAAYLRRYEDADVSRLKLLEYQRLKNPAITKSQLELLKYYSGKSKKLGRAPKEPKQKKEQEKQKSPLEVEIEIQERREKIRREERKLQQQDRFLQLEDFKQQREFVANERRIQQRELQRLTEFISGQNRIAADQQIANYNAAQAALRTRAQNDSRTAQALANRNQQAQLENRRLDIQQRSIDANFNTNREQRALRYAELDNDRARYEADVRRAEAQRDADIARTEAQFRDIQERVARDDAFRHKQLEEQQRLALENLAQQQRDNSLRHELEARKIENQRAVEAERSARDTFIISEVLAQLNSQRFQQYPAEFAEEEGLERGRRGSVLSLTSGEESTLADLESERYKSKQRHPHNQSPSQISPELETPSTREEEVEPTPKTTREPEPEDQPLEREAIYKPKVKTLAEVRKDNPVEDIEE